jgi:50S ribosomal subunit-associated GTPase HflX
MAECQWASRDKIARYLGVGKTTIDRAEAVVRQPRKMRKNTAISLSGWTAAGKLPALSGG